MRTSCPHPVVETLEDRILHSADLAPLTLAGAEAGTLAGQSAHWGSNDLVVQRNEIVFVDAALPDAGALIADLRAQADAGRPIEIVRIAPGQDGLAVMSETLAGRRDITAIHVVTHGSDGALQLGSVTLDAATLMQRADEVALWGAALTADADLLLYGCDLAQTDLGQHLVRDLASLIGADVAASTDRTGAAALGGDWQLEFAAGQIDAALAPSFAQQMQWHGVLATYTVTTTSDLFLGLVPGSGTFRWAVGQANSNPGTDTIVFAVNGSFGIGSLGSGGDDNSAGDFDVLGSVNIIGNGTGSTIITGDGNDRALDLRSGTVNLSGMTIQGGHSNKGGGIAVQSAATATLTDVVVQNNFGDGSTKGAGIYVDGALTLRNVIVQNNGNASERADGAGIFVDSNGVLDARNVEIRGNLADDKDGGGLYLANNSQALLEKVTIAGNSAKNGGGIYMADTVAALVNVTVSTNVAADKGGGIYAKRDVTLDHVTVANNTALSGGGVFDDGSDGVRDVQIQSSLFSGNVGGNTNQALISLGYNLSTDNSAGFTGTGDLKNVASGLSALASNGGFTRTHAISGTSAALNAANPVTTLIADQRGVGYFGGRADIGAYENNPFGYAPTVTAISNRSTNEDTALGPIAFTVGDAESGAASLTITATSSNPALVPDGNIVLGGSGASRTISVTPAAFANSTANGGPATITITVSDGGNTVMTSFQVTVLAVNNAPTISLPAPQAVVEDGVLTLSGANAPVLADVDAGSSALQMTLAVAHGLLTLSQTTGLSFSTGNGSNNATMTLSGSLSAINAALAGLQYRPAANYSGADALSISVNDQGNSGSGGAKTTNASLAIAVSAVNDAPQLSVPGAQGTPLLTPLQFSSAGGNAISVSDVDAAGTALQLTLSTLAGGNGTLALGNLSGATQLSNDGMTIVLRGTLAQLNAALNTLEFTATGVGSARIDLDVDDLDAGAAGGALQDSDAVLITVSPDPRPVLSLSQALTTFTEGGAAVVLDPLVTVTDNTTLASASIRISGGYVAAQDQLLFTLDPATMGNNIASAYSGGVLTLTATGATTLAQWEAALRAVAYSNPSEQPNTTDRLLTITVNDGIADSAAQPFTLRVASVNDAPVLSGANDLAGIGEDEANNFGTLVASLISGRIGDVDAMAMSGIAVIGVDDSQGSWQYSTNSGSSWSAFGPTVSEGSARLLGADANTLVRFVPLANWNGSVANGLSFRAWDQSSGSPGGTADASSNGGTTPFSSALASSGVAVAAANDAPVLASANNLTPIVEDATGDGGTLVSALLAGQVTEPDVAPLSGMAVIAVDDSNGVWQYTRDGGSNWLDFGTVSDGAARLLAADAGTAVRFVANADWNGTVALGLEFRAWDQTSGTAGALGDASVNGGSTAFSSASAASSITVSNVNDAPTVATPLADQAATQGVGFNVQIPVDAFEDIDAGDVLAYGATLAGGGALPAWLAFDGATRTFSGTPGNADVGTVSVEVTATDGSGASVSDQFTLTVANVNDAPTVAAPLPDQAAVEDALFSFTFASGAFVDIDAGDTLSYAATLSSGAALPSWLSFDANTRTFSGTPGNADVGSITVRVTATDAASASVSDDFTLTVANANDAPTVAAGIADQAATEDALFSFTFASGAFVDIDAGDTLSYAATLSSGAALPSWLSFDAGTRTFSGTPGNAEVGSITVRVTATDAASASVSDDFTLTVANANDAPTVAAGIADQAATEDALFSFTFASGAFVDIDAGDTLSYAATLSSGAALPSWLSFDANTRTFSGTPGNADVGSITVRVTANDAASASVSDDFTLTVANVNDAPTVAAGIDDQLAAEDVPLSFTIDAGSFADPDAADTLTFGATLSGGAALPAWLSFDAGTRTFSGTPGNGDVGSIVIRVTATDATGASVFDDFTLAVANTNDTPTLAAPLADQAATQDAAFRFTFAAATFADVDAGDTLTYRATLASGAALPSWLTFDAATRSFSGTPTNADVGTLAVRVFATDAANASVTDDFALLVANVNDAPQPGSPLANREASPGSPFSFQLPGASFIDPDVGDTLRYSATQADGSVLPPWLVFDASTRRFTGTPADANLGPLNVRVTVTDGGGLQAQGLFTLTVFVAGLDAVQVIDEPPAPPPAPAVQPAAAAAPAATAEPEAPPTEASETALPDAAPPLALGQDTPAITIAFDTPPGSANARVDSVESGSSSQVAGRADAVLTELVAPQFATLSASPLNQVLRGDEVSRKFEEMQRQMQEQAEARSAIIGSSVLVSGGVSIGYVIWLVRGGVLMSSMLSALPAWQMIDPLPVLAAARDGRDGRRGGSADDGDVERLFDDKAAKQPPPGKAAPPQSARVVAGSAEGGPAKVATVQGDKA